MSIIRRVANGASAFVIACSSLMTLAIPMTAHAASPTCTWTGAGSDKKFSNALNWSGCAGAPTDNDILTFDITSLTADVTVSNDISALTVDGINIIGTGNYRFTLAGDFTVNGDIAATSAVSFIDNLTLAKNIAVGGVVSFADSGSLNVAAYNLAITSGFVYFDGTVSGSGAINLSTGGAFAVLDGDASAFTGAVQMVSGAGAELSPSTLSASASLTVASGASLTLCSFNGASMATPLTVGGDTSFASSAVITAPMCGAGGVATLGVNPKASVNWTGAITLTANTVIDGAGDFKVTGPLSGAFTLTQKAGSTGQVTIAASANTSKTANGTQVSQFLSTTYSENQPTVSIDATPNQEAILSGTYLNANVNGGILKGTGTLKGALNVYSTGTVAPGNSPGCITSDTLALQGIYLFEMGGADPCTGYDQLKVLNATNAADAVTLDAATATLTTSLYNSYAPKKGQVFIIIDQAGDKLCWWYW